MTFGESASQPLFDSTEAVMDAVEAVLRLAKRLADERGRDVNLSNVLRPLLETTQVLSYQDLNKVVKLAPISEAANTLISEPIKNHRHGVSMGLRWEHPVPFKILIEMLFGAEDRAQIAEILNQYHGAAWITLGEDKTLQKSSMPPGWKFGDSKFARYEFAGIKLTTQN